MSPQQATIMKFVPWFLGPVSFFVTWKMAASVQLFFATTALLQYVQTTLWHVPSIRRICGLPPLEEMMAAAKSAPSPFASGPRIHPAKAAGGIQYQAPRTVNTTATSTTAGAAAADSDNPIAAARESWASVKEKWDKRNATKDINSGKAEATDYEKKRLREENEQYLKRREAAAARDSRKK